MDHYKVNRRDIFFILKDQLNYGSLCGLARYQGLDEKTLDMLVTEALAFAQKEVAPLQEIGDARGVVFENKKVTCPPEFKKVFSLYGEQGFISASRDETYGGQGFPHMMRIVVNDVMYGACQSFNMAPSLTHGAAHLIEAFGDPELKERFVPACYEGKWSGTMCLTEPQAGSDLGAIETLASPTEDGYLIQGEKIFISWGDHDLTENIIHLVLARTPDAPSGTRGLSLFVAPKIRVKPDGSLGEPNDVVCRKVEKKMGLTASPTCELAFGANGKCVGYLCGEKNKGLAHMFQMMNAARINSGVSGMAIAGAAYQNALAYCKGRLQGRDLARRKPGAVPIMDHPDVRRMLLWSKAVVDGMRSMIYSGAFWQDLSQELEAGPEKEHYKNLVDFMTPIIKCFCTETSFRVCETSMQCLGGYGYVKDFPIEQYLRDSKILSLYEGTSGIQSMDLLGRKMTLNQGAALSSFKREFFSFCDREKTHPDLGNHVASLASTGEELFNACEKLVAMLKIDPLQWASSTYPALMCFGELSLCWRLLDMAVVADKKKESDFFKGKILQAAWYADTNLPVVRARVSTIPRQGREITDMPEGAF